MSNRPETKQIYIDSFLMIGHKDHPDPLPAMTAYYEHDFSRHPASIRMSFEDGTTVIYDIRRDQPHPLVLKNIKIMRQTERNIKQGYVNKPARRRRK